MMPRNDKQILYEILLSLLLFANLFVGNDYSVILFSILFLIYILTSNVLDSVNILFYIMPFYRIIQFGNYNICFIFQFLILAKALIRKRTVPAVPLGTFVIMAMVASYSTLSSDGNIVSLLSVLINYLCILFVLLVDNNISVFTKWLSGLTNASLIGLLREVLPKLDSMMDSTDYVMGTSYSRFSGLSFDSNLFAMCVLVTIACFMCLSYRQHQRKSVIVRLAILVFLGVFTYSKMYYLGIVLLFILYWLLMPGKKIKRFFQIVFYGGIVLIFLMTFSGGSLWSTITGRFSYSLGSYSSKFNDFSTNRAETWENYINWMKYGNANLLVGNGVTFYLAGTGAAHNLLIELISKVGFIGSSSFVLYIVSIAKANKHNQKYSCRYIPVIVVLLCGIVLSVFSSECLWTAIYFCLIRWKMPIRDSFLQSEGEKCVE